MGPRVDEFEEAFARFCGARTAIAVANGTAALHLALLAVDCGPGDEVLVPSLNFVAAANTIAHTGATPVFCDVTSSLDLNVDPEDIDGRGDPSDARRSSSCTTADTRAGWTRSSRWRHGTGSR